MDDIIVIILTLVVALVGILNKAKKKKEAQSPKTESTNESSDFWDMLMDDGKVEEENSPEYLETEPEAVEVIERKPKPGYKFLANNEGTSDIKEEMKETRGPKKKIMVQGEEFSLRKAVIFSEILNRKYT